MLETEAAEGKISGFLFPNRGQAQVDATLPITQEASFVRPTLPPKCSLFQTPQRNFVIQPFC